MADLEKFIQDMNRAWQQDRFDAVQACYAENAIMLVPGRAEPISGAAAITDSYREFVETAEVHAFDVTDIRLFEYPSSTVCHTAFTVDYEIESGRFTEHGVDVYVIDDSGESPTIIWRTQIVDH